MEGKELEERLDEYFESNSEYMLSINGLWGTGKTHFIREYMKNKFKKKNVVFSWVLLISIGIFFLAFLIKEFNVLKKDITLICYSLKLSNINKSFTLLDVFFVLFLLNLSALVIISLLKLFISKKSKKKRKEVYYYSLVSLDNVSDVEDDIKFNKNNVIKLICSLMGKDLGYNDIKSKNNSMKKKPKNYKRIFIFDDVERFLNSFDEEEAKNQMIRLFALMNELNQLNNVIFLVDEEKIRQKDDFAENKIEFREYYQYKEKYVGEEYKLTPKPKDICDSFVNNNNLNTFMGIQILVVFEENKITNLRIIIKTLEHFKRILKVEKIILELKITEELIKVILHNILFYVVRMEKRKSCYIESIKRLKGKINFDLLHYQDEYNNEVEMEINRIPEVSEDINICNNHELAKEELSEIKYSNQINLISDEYIFDIVKNNICLSDDKIHKFISNCTKIANRLFIKTETSKIGISFSNNLSNEEYNNLLKEWKKIIGHNGISISNLLVLEILLIRDSVIYEDETLNDLRIKMDDLYSKEYYRLYENGIPFFKKREYIFKWSEDVDYKLRNEKLFIDLKSNSNVVKKINLSYEKYVNEKYLKFLDEKDVYSVVKSVFLYTHFNEKEFDPKIDLSKIKEIALEDIKEENLLKISGTINIIIANYKNNIYVKLVKYLDTYVSEIFNNIEQIKVDGTKSYELISIKKNLNVLMELTKTRISNEKIHELMINNIDLFKAIDSSKEISLKEIHNIIFENNKQDSIFRENEFENNLDNNIPFIFTELFNTEFKTSIKYDETRILIDVYKRIEGMKIFKKGNKRVLAIWINLFLINKFKICIDFSNNKIRLSNDITQLIERSNVMVNENNYDNLFIRNAKYISLMEDEKLEESLDNK